MKHGNIRDKIVSGITTHVCTSRKRNFPRQIGFPHQHEIKTTDELINDIFAHIEYSNCYASLFSQWQIINQTFDKLYIDIDSSRLMNAYKDMQKVSTYFSDYFNYEPRITFTANKGFAIYCDYPENKIDFMKGYYLVIHLISVLKLKYADLKVSRDIKRITRVPYSLNFNTLKCNNELKLCVPIDPSWSLHQIISESKNCKFKQDIIVEPNEEIFKVINSIKLPKYKAPTEQHQCTYKTDNEQIKRIVSCGIFTDGRHRILCRILIPYLVQQNNTSDEIIQTCTEFLNNNGKDIKEYISFISYHITRNRNHHYKPQSLSELLINNSDIYTGIRN